MVFFAAVLRITADYCFHSSNFLRGHVHVGIRSYLILSYLLFACLDFIGLLLDLVSDITRGNQHSVD